MQLIFTFNWVFRPLVSSNPGNSKKKNRQERNAGFIAICKNSQRAKNKLLLGAFEFAMNKV